MGSSEPVVEIPNLIEYSHYTFSPTSSFFADTLGLDNMISIGEAPKSKREEFIGIGCILLIVMHPTGSCCG